ncbi:MAG: coproporphyrinogen dehydrogenase HemZ [Firmicutes bacterium]|nr:coproporphyrinogen dehydrogenase HemZ [Bacillota bacterium]
MLTTNIPNIYAELNEVVRIFITEDSAADFVIDFSLTDKIVIRINNQIHTFPYPKELGPNPIIQKRNQLRTCKKALFLALKAHFKQNPPWGALTGIRPTKLVYEMQQEENSLEVIAERLQSEYFVSPQKADLACEIVKNQKGYFEKKPHLVNLYIHVPFCPTRCHYCSFISVPIQKQKHLVAEYVENLCIEIENAKNLIKQNNQEIYSVYIGGGTPTVLEDAQFESVLKAIAVKNLPIPKIEFSCEAGRPDTITDKKIALMQKYGVTRVSVNPQSLNDTTLQKIGRGHSAQDFFDVFQKVKAAGFIINVDLMAGLEGESITDFQNTLDQILPLSPYNITVHTLAAKRGSKLFEEKQIKPTDGFIPLVNSVSAMTDYALDTLKQNNYKPYYLYRQKRAQENLENVGFSLPNTQCVNNITVMEEMLSVVACGAGAISKKINHATNYIERYANPKDVKLYLERFNTILLAKLDFLC